MTFKFMVTIWSQKNIAFIASTLPLYLLNQKIKEWNIGEVYIQGDSIFNSTNILRKKYPKIIIKVLNSSRQKNNLLLLLAVLGAKIFSRRIYIFHESCWPILDLLVKFIRPKGDFRPHVTLEGLKDASADDIKLKIQSVIKRILLTSFFIVKKEINDGGSQESFILIPSVKNYPKTIKIYNLYKNNSYREKSGTKKAVLFVSRELIEDHILVDFYTKIVHTLKDHKYICSLKDHPRDGAELGLELTEFDVVFDRHYPAEMLDLDDHSLAIGLFSTALSSFNGLSISICGLINGYSAEQREQRKKHLESLTPGKVIYPDSWEEFVKLIN
jgi:hypothetical protein